MVDEHTPPVVAVVVAAGLGTRFGGPVPKQVTSLTGKAVVAVAVESLAAGGCDEVVVVVKEGMHNHLQLALAASPIPVHFVTGGDTRQDSVRNGLRYIADDEHLGRATTVLIHDAVRPLVPAYIVEDVIDAVEAGAVAVTPVVEVTDTIRQIDGEGSRVIDRSALRAVQTPQGFDRVVITECHEQLSRDGGTVTDDISCCERYGHRATLVEGSRMALKITEPVDLDIAEVLAKAAAGAGHHSGRRVGRMLRAVTPSNVHQLSEGVPMHIAGLHFPDEKVGLAGHSDGDVACHAICDALLSATGLGDVGSVFGTSDPQWAGAAGVALLGHVVELVIAEGWAVQNAAVQIVGQRPRMAARRAEAVATLTQTVGAPVSVSATTTDHLGFTGRGEGVAAIASALVTRQARS